jgi:hypothetical protein
MSTTPSHEHWPIEIVSLGRTRAGAMLSRRGGQLELIIVVKATFTFVTNGTMPLTDPADILRADEHYDGAPQRSVRAPSDRVPLRERADVLFAGHAYSPPTGPRAHSLAVRLALARSDQILLDKVIHVYGDRTPTVERPSPEPAAFRRMPIIYERAFGGEGSPSNPVGLGLWSARGHGHLPNLLYPDPWHRGGEPAGFGPIPPRWPARARLLNGHPIEALEGPITEIPDDIDIAFFQAAPDDQRIAHLQGNEWILLENLHALHPRMLMGLPNARAEARVYSRQGMEVPIALAADTLFLDGDAELCSVTWRGSYPLAHEGILESLSAAAGVETLGHPIEWPTAAGGRPPPVTVGISTATVVLGTSVPSAVEPFPLAKPGEAPADAHPKRIPGAPFSTPSSPSSGAEVGSDEAMTMRRGASAAKTTKATETPDGTVTIPTFDPSKLQSLNAPFRITKSGPASQSAVAPTPGAPWEPGGGAPAVTSSTSLNELTLVSPDPAALATLPFLQPNAPEEEPVAASPEPEPPPEPPPKPPPPEPPPPPIPQPQRTEVKDRSAPNTAPDEKPSWHWASAPPDNAPIHKGTPAAPVAPARAPAGPPIRTTLYDKFTKKKK